MPTGKQLSIDISDSIASIFRIKQSKNCILTGWQNNPQRL